MGFCVRHGGVTEERESFTHVVLQISDEFSDVFLKSLDTRSGDALPVSSFKHGGETPIGPSEFQKRGPADEVPEWIPDACTQCNLCSIVCPHAVILTFQSSPSSVLVPNRLRHTIKNQRRHLYSHTVECDMEVSQVARTRTRTHEHNFENCKSEDRPVSR